MRKLLLFISLITVTILLTRCTQSSQKQENVEDQSNTPQAIRLYKAPPSPEFADASLTLKSYTSEETEDGLVAKMDFEVNNYELGVQTEGYDTRGIAVSPKGQHIHLIINNGPYSAHYEPFISKRLEEGSYVAIAFLSRSYHESVKNDSSYWIDVIKVGNPADDPGFDFSAPHLFYSRPKGTYSGKDTEKLMIDFFLLNTTLAPDGNKVRATINGEIFVIDEWAPYYVEGLPKGEVQIKLELIDNNGNVIPGPFNVTERTVKLVEATP